MRKNILDGIIASMEQVGDLERSKEQKRADQNAFKLDEVNYKRSDLYPMILGIPNPQNKIELDESCWAMLNRGHIETGEREVPLEDLKLAWKYVWGQEQIYEKKYNDDKTVKLRDYINKHDAELRIRFKELISKEKFNVNDKQYDSYTAMQWLVWLMIMEEKEYFFLCSPKQTVKKYNVSLNSHKLLSEKISGKIKNTGNMLILYGKQFIGKTVFTENCLPGLAGKNGCYILDCGQKSFGEFLNSLRNRQDEFWLKFQMNEPDSQIILPYNIDNIGLKQNLLRLKEIEAGHIVIWDNIASRELNNYMEQISKAGFQFQSVLVADMAVMDGDIREKIPEDDMIQIPNLSDQEMWLVAESIVLKSDRKLKNGMNDLPQDDKEYLKKMIPDLNGNIALLELVLRNYLALKKKQGQEEAEKFLKNIQDYKDISPADRKTAKFKKTGTSSSFDNNIRTVFQQSISNEERLKITILSLLNGQKISAESLQKYFKISGDDLGRFLEDGIVEAENGSVAVKIHPIIPEMLFPFLRKNTENIEGSYSNEELRECLEYVIRLIGELMQLSPKLIDEKELTVIVDAVIKRIYFLFCENQSWFMSHFDEYFTLMMKYRLFLLEYGKLIEYDGFRDRMDHRDFRISGKYYKGADDIYDKKMTDLKKGMFQLLDWEKMYKEVLSGDIGSVAGDGQEDLICTGKEIRDAEKQIEPEINFLLQALNNMITMDIKTINWKQFHFDVYNIEGMLEPIIRQKLDDYFLAMYWYYLSKNDKLYTMNKNTFIMFVQKFLHIENEHLQDLCENIRRVYGHSLEILRRKRGYIQIVTFKTDNSLSMKDKTDAIQDLCLQYLSLECLCHYDHNDWMNSVGEFQELYINLFDWVEIVTIKDISLNFLVGIVNEHFTRLIEYVKEL